MSLIAFQLFGATHLATIAVIAGVTVAMIVAVRSRRDAAPRRLTCFWVLTLLSAVTVGGAVFQQTYELRGGVWTVQDSLPLHICSIGVIVIAAALLRVAWYGTPPWRWGRPAPVQLADNNPTPSHALPTQRLYELAYYWGMSGTLQALITPDVPAPFPEPEYFPFFVTHGGIVAGVLLLTIGFQMRPRPRSWRWVFLATLGLAAFVLVFNVVTDSNYMYLLRPPVNPSVLDHIGTFPWSLLSLVVLGGVLLLIWYAPWKLYDWWRQPRDVTPGGEGPVSS